MAINVFLDQQMRCEVKLSVIFRRQRLFYCTCDSNHGWYSALRICKFVYSYWCVWFVPGLMSWETKKHRQMWWWEKQYGDRKTWVMKWEAVICSKTRLAISFFFFLHIHVQKLFVYTKNENDKYVEWHFEWMTIKCLSGLAAIGSTQDCLFL